MRRFTIHIFALFKWLSIQLVIKWLHRIRKITSWLDFPHTRLVLQNGDMNIRKKITSSPGIKFKYPIQKVPLLWNKLFGSKELILKQHETANKKNWISVFPELAYNSFSKKGILENFLVKAYDKAKFQNKNCPSLNEI